MEDIQERVREMLNKHSDLRSEMRDIEHRLAEEVTNYKGSLADAMTMGLIKLNFPAPPGFYRHMRSR